MLLEYSACCYIFIIEHMLLHVQRISHVFSTESSSTEVKMAHNVCWQLFFLVISEQQN